MYGFPLTVTVQAIVGLADGEPFALIGLARIEGQAVLFSEYKPGFKAHLRHPACLRAILKMAGVMRARGVPTLALADADEPDSGRLLQRLGFVQIESTEDGGLYKWHS